MPVPARSAWMIPPRPWRAKDFALIKRDGLYHIFYTRTNINSPYGATSESSFGHAVSSDLFVWATLDTVLPLRSDGWDNFKVWAPTIVQSDGVYYMLYAGVTDHPGGAQFHQQIGLATSTDLMQWNRFDAPVFTCDQVAWAYCDSTLPAGGNFRDPFVMADPSAPGHWLMYYTTVPNSDLSSYQVGLASSAGPFDAWSDIKPMLITDKYQSGWDLAESPHLFQHDGQWFFFWTTSSTEPIVWATGLDPTGDPASWNYHGSLASMLGFSTRFWFASEELTDGLIDYLAFVNFDRVDIRLLNWGAGGSFTLPQPDNFHVRSLAWSRDSTETGWADTLTIKSINAHNRSAIFEVAALDSVTGAERLIAPSSVGLPDSVALPDTVTRFVWLARRVTDSNGVIEAYSRYVVRTQNLTASAGVLVVGPPGSCSGGDQGGGEIIDPALTQGNGSDGASLRTLARTPVSDGPALLVELRSAAHARLEMFDLQGRRVALLADRDLNAGATVLPWDAAARGGIGRGVYFARLTTPLGMRWSRVLVLR